jgi:cytochrome c-type biogenesis protein CcmH/NrfF
MRTELSNALRKGDSDDAILHAFVQNYGADVLEQSSTVANELIWTLALVALTSITIVFVRKRKTRPASSAMPVSEFEDADSLRDRVRRETERDDW